MNVIHKRGWRVCLLDNKKTTWNQLLSKQSFFLLQPLSSTLQSLSYSTRSLTHHFLPSSLVHPRLRQYCLRDVMHTTLLLHFTNADSAFQIHYKRLLFCTIWSYLFASSLILHWYQFLSFEVKNPCTEASSLSWLLKHFQYRKWAMDQNKLIIPRS